MITPKISEPTFAIILLNWNGLSLLKRFLPILLEHSGTTPIYVADNASTDGSVTFVRNHFPTVNCITLDQNYGYAAGYNHALTQIEADVYCLMNTDIEVTPGWLDPIKTLFNSEISPDIVQPKIRDHKRPEYFEYAGAAGGFIDAYGFAYCRGRIFESIEIDKKQYEGPSPIFWASGACFFIRKNVYWDLGGFDADFFAHQEEIDLCWRAFNRNYKTYYCSQSQVFHIGGATLSYGNPQKTYLNFRNSLLMMVKNLPKRKLFSTLFVRLCLDGIAGVRMLLQGQPKHCWAVVQAHFGFYKRLKKMTLKREVSQRTDYYQSTSIIIEYFVKKRKVFTK